MVLRVLLHTVAASVMLYGYTSLSRLEVFGQWVEAQYGGHSQYLTINGLFAAVLVMISGVLIDLVGIASPSAVTRQMSPAMKQLIKTKRLLLLIAMPISVVVAAVYWPLIIFWPHLMLAQLPSDEPTLDSPATLFRIPADIDIPLHGLPGPFLLLDFFLFEQKFSRRAMDRIAPLLAIILAVTYSVWVEYCASRNGYFPYPFLTTNTLLIRAVIYATCTMFSVASIRLVNWLHR
ncbi:hypothetical protein M408DRAFT_248160 [Serendipita vermifera MAFF 305830]|uniref:FAR-17a/AIG1-like protein n=1 Tax=Serendipita vermifera MAFF 305830 TaxID=933852 RepID=A0A0C2X3S9_SERVB|nr:hypothetical protein M408DRAFT_248160 [Serendipita vermifera MAFF 305830]